MLHAQENDAPSDVDLTMAYYANSDTCGGDPQYMNYNAHTYNMLTGGNMPYGECYMQNDSMMKFYCSGGSWTQVLFNSNDANCTGTPVYTTTMVRRVFLVACLSEVPYGGSCRMIVFSLQHGILYTYSSILPLGVLSVSMA